MHLHQGNLINVLCVNQLAATGYFTSKFSAWRSSSAEEEP